VNARSRYATPAAFRRALADRLKEASKGGRRTLQQLQRQVAYDRLIGRLYLADDRWIIKGATALLARDLGVRGTLDIDLYLEAEREAGRPRSGGRPSSTLATGSASRSAGEHQSATTPSGFQ
jgi:hypothetical protein